MFKVCTSKGLVMRKVCVNSPKHYIFTTCKAKSSTPTTERAAAAHPSHFMYGFPPLSGSTPLLLQNVDARAIHKAYSGYFIGLYIVRCFP